MHGLDPTSASNSWQQYDHDGDGLDDRTENRGGTNRYDANEYPASPTPVPAPDTSMEATPDQDLSIGAPITDADALGAQSTLLREALPEQFAIVVDEPQAFEPVQVEEPFVEEPFVEELFVDELPDLIELDVDSNGDYFALTARLAAALDRRLVGTEAAVWQDQAMHPMQRSHTARLTGAGGTR